MHRCCYTRKSWGVCFKARKAHMPACLVTRRALSVLSWRVLYSLHWPAVRYLSILAAVIRYAPC